MPIQTRYVGEVRGPFTVPYASAFPPTPPVPATTAHVLHSADGQRKTAFWVTTEKTDV